MDDLKNHVHVQLQGVIQSCEEFHAHSKMNQDAIAKDLKNKQKDAQAEVGEMLSKSQDLLNTGLTEQGKRATAWEEMMVTNSAAIKTERASASKRLQDHQNNFEATIAQWMAQNHP